MRIVTILLLCPGLLSAAPSFDVATVKRSAPEEGNHDRESWQNGILKMGNVTLKQIVRYAYGISETQIFGGPKWMDDYRFDIVGKADAKTSAETLQTMLQPLLAERFHFTFHHEMRTVAGFALEVAKRGIIAPVSTRTDGPGSGTSSTSINATDYPMSMLAIRLAVVLERPVVDMTGDTRAFDIKLKWAPEGSNSELPALFTAVDEQLGLKLESRKVPVDAIVIDLAELPGDN